MATQNKDQQSVRKRLGWMDEPIKPWTESGVESHMRLVVKVFNPESSKKFKFKVKVSLIMLYPW